MATTDPIEWSLYDTDLITKLAILPVAQGHLYIEMNEPGSGEVRIPLDSTIAASVSSGRFIVCNYRGAARGGFFIDNIKQTEADQGEGGGRWLSASGRGPLAILEDALVWDDGSGATVRAFTGKTKAYILKTLIDEAKTRGALTRVTYDFTATTSSDSVSWSDSEDYDINVGQTILDVLRMFAKTGEIEFGITLQGGSTPILLSAYKNGIGSDKSATVYMRIGSNCEEVSTDERGDEIKNVYLTKYKDGYITNSDATSITNRRRRETFLQLEQAQSSDSASTYAAAQLTGTKDPKISRSLRVFDGVTPYLFVNYVLGDTVTVDKFGTQVSKRILGVQADFDGDRPSNVVLEMETIFYNNDLRITSKLDDLKKRWATARDNNLSEVKRWFGVGQPNGTIYALHYYGGYLYVGGDFTAISDRLITTNIARYNVTTGAWSALDAGITSAAVIAITDVSGEIYAATLTNVYHWTAGSWSLIGTDAGPIKAMVGFGGDLYVGGVGIVFDSGGSAQAVMKWVGSAPWQASLAYPTSCLALAVYNSDLYGGFNTSTSSALRHLNSGAWSTVMAAPTDGTNVKAITAAGSSLVYAGGATDEKVYRWDGSSSTREDLYTVSPWGDPGGGSHDALGAYLSDVYHGSVFTTINSSAVYGNLVRYSGGIFNTMEGGISTAVSDRLNAICVVDSDIYIGGKFTTAGGRAISNLAVWITSFQSLIDHLTNNSSFDMGAAIHAATAITTPTDNDEFPLWEDTAQNLRKVTWANEKATLKTYFDTIYATSAGDVVTAQLFAHNDLGLIVRTRNSDGSFVHLIGKIGTGQISGVLDSSFQSATVSTTELITNGDFEGNTLTGWTLTGSPSVVSGGFEGSYAARCTASDTIKQTITVVSGSYYLLEFAAKIAGSPQAVVTYNNADASSYNPANQQTGKWVRGAALIKTSSTSTTLEFKANGGTDYVYFDNISLKLVSGAFNLEGMDSSGRWNIVTTSASPLLLNGVDVSARLVTNGDTHAHGGGADGAQVDYGNLLNTPVIPAAETQTANLFRPANSPGGTSAFAGTIATLPGGAPTTLTYNVTSGTENAMVPQATTNLGKMRLYNTTRGNHALISNCNAATNTITLTANVPAGWAVTDVITIASQTVSGGSFAWVDIEITSGPTTRTQMFMWLSISSATVGDSCYVHPFETYAVSKIYSVTAQAAGTTILTMTIVKIVSNVFTIAWSGTPTAVLYQEAGYLQ